MVFSNCEHRLGNKLLDWSINVRENIGSVNWLGSANLADDTKSERYMIPSTIIEVLNNHPLCQEYRRPASN